MDDRSPPKLPRSGAKPAGVGVRGSSPLAQFVRERLANDPVWSVVAQNGKWICPYCLNGVIKRVGRSQEESLAMHLEGCRAYAGGRGQAQPQNLVEERMHFENMTHQAESQPAWRVYDQDGVWFCPACLDRVAAVRLQGGQLSNFVFQAMAGHLRNCASYRQGVMHPPEDLMAARDRYARAPGLGATVIGLLQQTVWRYTNTSGQWVCPLCLAHVPEVVVVQPTDWQHAVDAMAKHLLLHCGNFDPERIETQPEEVVQQAAGGRLRGGTPNLGGDRTPTGGATRVGLPVLPQRQGGRMPTVARTGNSGGHAISPSAGNVPITGAQQISGGTPLPASPLQVTPKPGFGPTRTPIGLQPASPTPPPASPAPNPPPAAAQPIGDPDFLPFPVLNRTAPPAAAPPPAAVPPPASPMFAPTPAENEGRAPLRRSLQTPMRPPAGMQPPAFPPPIQVPMQAPPLAPMTAALRTPSPAAPMPPPALAPVAAALRTPPPQPLVRTPSPLRTPPPLPDPQIISPRPRAEGPLFGDIRGDPLLGTPLGNIDSDRVRAPVADIRPESIRPEFEDDFGGDLPPDEPRPATPIADDGGHAGGGLDWMEDADRASNTPDLEPHERTDVIHAREFQGTMLAHTPSLPGYTFATRYEACSDITGDFYEFITMADGRVGFALADVSGHGVQAGLIMSMAKKTLEIYASIGHGPADTLAKVNDALARDLGGKMFISMVYGILSPDTRSITWARAGGTPVLRLSAQTGELTEVKPKGMVLGMKSGPIFRQSLEEQVTRLDAGDHFLLYTDGITETMNSSQEEFGSDRLGEVLRSYANERPDHLLDMVMERLRMFRGPLAVSDDLTMLALAVE
jgi:hypothetical protein